MTLSMSDISSFGMGLGATEFSKATHGPCYQLFARYDAVENAYLAQPRGSAAETMAKKELDSAGADLRKCRSGQEHKDWQFQKAVQAAGDALYKGPSPPIDPNYRPPGWPSKPEPEGPVYGPQAPVYIQKDPMPSWVPYVLGGMAAVAGVVLLGKAFGRSS